MLTCRGWGDLPWHCLCWGWHHGLGKFRDTSWLLSGDISPLPLTTSTTSEALVYNSFIEIRKSNIKYKKTYLLRSEARLDMSWATFVVPVVPDISRYKYQRKKVMKNHTARARDMS